jgi:hypothetical protein
VIPSQPVVSRFIAPLILAEHNDLRATDRRVCPVAAFRIFGSAGHALVDATNGTLAIHFADGSIREEPPLGESERASMRQSAWQIVDVILGNGEVLVGGELGLLTVEFLAAAMQSARTGAEVPLRA